jgi:hypothetical protein
MVPPMSFVPLPNSVIGDSAFRAIRTVFPSPCGTDATGRVAARYRRAGPKLQAAAEEAAPAPGPCCRRPAGCGHQRRHHPTLANQRLNATWTDAEVIGDDSSQVVDGSEVDVIDRHPEMVVMLNDMKGLDPVRFPAEREPACHGRQLVACFRKGRVG